MPQFGASLSQLLVHSEFLSRSDLSVDLADLVAVYASFLAVLSQTKRFREEKLKRSFLGSRG